MAVQHAALSPDSSMQQPVLEWPEAREGLMPFKPTYRFRTTIGAAAFVSVALHVAAASLFFLNWQRNELGVLAEPTDAINVEFVETETLESTPADVKEVTAGSASAVAQAVGADSDSQAKSVSEIKPDESAVSSQVIEAAPSVAPPAPLASVEPTETVIAGTADDEASLPPPQASTEQSQRRVERPEQPQKKRSEQLVRAKAAKKSDEAESETKRKGGAASRASVATKAGASRASASTGDIAGYAARVRARVAGNKPSGGGQKGTPTVSFGVSQSGGLSFVRLKRSSGVSALDQAAMGAVRRAAPFPPPPPGVSASKLSFTMPIYFR